MMKKFFRYIFYLFYSFVAFSFPLFSSDNFRIGLLAGYFYPSQSEFREIYGSGFPFCISFSFKIKNNFYLSSGYESIDLKGEALGEGEDEYPLKFKMRSISISLLHRIQFRKITLAVGGGLSRNFFKERWETLPIQYSGREDGYHCFANLEIPFKGIFSFITSFKYERIFTKKSAFSKKIDIGGLKMLFGISAKLI